MGSCFNPAVSLHDAATTQRCHRLAHEVSRSRGFAWPYGQPQRGYADCSEFTNHRFVQPRRW
ncbi:hypothetical protein D9M73_188010 [compost metagenome]